MTSGTRSHAEETPERRHAIQRRTAYQRSNRQLVRRPARQRLLSFQCGDERTAYFAGIAMTLVNQCSQYLLDSAKLCKSLSNHREFPSAESLRLAAVSAIFESKQISNLLKAESQSLRLSDKAQPAGMSLRVPPDTAQRPDRLADQTATLVIANGLHVDARVFRKCSNGVLLLGHLDSVVDYGLKVTLSSRIATGMDVMSQTTVEKRTVEKGTLLAGGLAAILASTCCLGPLVLVTLGVSGAWIGNLTILEPYRPIFIGVALVALYFAWRRIFRPVQECEPGEVCAVPQIRVTYKIIFWVVAALVLVALAFPYVLPLFY